MREIYLKHSHKQHNYVCIGNRSFAYLNYHAEDLQKNITTISVPTVWFQPKPAKVVCFPVSVKLCIVSNNNNSLICMPTQIVLGNYVKIGMLLHGTDKPGVPRLQFGQVAFSTNNPMHHTRSIRYVKP